MCLVINKSPEGFLIINRINITVTSSDRAESVIVSRSGLCKVVLDTPYRLLELTVAY